MTQAHEPFDEAMLTAYVLGELNDDEAAEVRQRIEGDEALRDEVEAIRETAEKLEKDFAAEPAHGLTEVQRESIVAGEEEDRPAVIFTMRRVMRGAALAAAACIAFLLVLPVIVDIGGKNDDVAFDATARVDAFKQNEGARKRGLQAGEAGGAALEKDRDARLGIASASAPLEREPVASEEVPASGTSAGRMADELAYLRATETATAGERSDRGAVRDNRAGSDNLRARRAPVEGKRLPPGPPPKVQRPARPSRARPEGEKQAAGGGGVADAERFERQSDTAVAEPALDDSPRERARGEFSREAYGRLIDNPFIRPEGKQALSTLAVDVDTASYANVRRFIESGRLPPPDAVRIEELINYFSYSYDAASGEHPFSAGIDASVCPWNPEHRLVRIGLRAREVDPDMRPATSLVFLVDVSGSMRDDDKLPLVRESLKLLVENLTADDRIAIVTYAGTSGLVLPSTYCDEREQIVGTIDRLTAGGSTHGSAGIQLAYEVAQQNFIKGGVNRVILCTDGDFNVGVSDEGGLVRLIEEKRESGVYLSILGFGTGNLQDQKMEMLSNHGNGTWAYIDSLREAKRQFVEHMAGTLVTVAKDVKVQVEFNPAHVNAYRLIGYANRLLRAEDFNDKTKDAGDVGAGHTVTVLYEIVPIGVEIDLPKIDNLKYQQPEQPSNDDEAEDDAEAAASSSDELLTLKLAYKQPEAKRDDESTNLEIPFVDPGETLEDASGDYQFAAAVAAFGMILRDSPYKGDATYESVLDLAANGLENDPDGRRAEFVKLVEQAKQIASQQR